jgi:hypothetical protein
VTLARPADEQASTSALDQSRSHEKYDEFGTAEQRDELAALHSITSSVTASRDAGTVRASMSVWALMTSSNLLDFATGKSAGCAFADAARVDAGLTIGIHNIGAIAHQSAGFGSGTMPPTLLRSARR